MQKINFEPIGEAMKAFDTDKMDIYRRMPITNPDGTQGETDLSEPIYKDVACHVAFQSADNSNPETVDTAPIIVGVQINCPNEVDIQKGDYVKAYKLSNAGEVLEEYYGTVGKPSTSQSRKSVLMEMKTNV